MKFFVCYYDINGREIAEFKNRPDMLEFVLALRARHTEILCVWTEL